MAKFTKHTCIGDQRWDTIAQMAYGDCTKIADILSANKHLEIHSVIPGGTILNVPIVEIAPVNVIGLPPWKQQASTEGVETAKAAAGILAALQFTSATSTDGSFDGSFD
jgi:hypothetical protein